MFNPAAILNSRAVILLKSPPRRLVKISLLRLQAVQAKLDAETEKKHDLLPSSFVVFRTLRTSALAAQAKWEPSPLSFDIMPAPEFSNVIWNNLSIGLWAR